jgi:hypothetical protein
MAVGKFMDEVALSLVLNSFSLLLGAVVIVMVVTAVAVEDIEFSSVTVGGGVATLR